MSCALRPSNTDALRGHLSRISCRACPRPDSPDEPADLLRILEEAVNVVLSQFDCGRSTCPSHTSFAFTVAKSDFPSPAGAVQQLNNGKFHTSMFHGILSPTAWTRMVPRSQACTGSHTKRTSPYVHFWTERNRILRPAISTIFGFRTLSRAMAFP